MLDCCKDGSFFSNLMQRFTFFFSLHLFRFYLCQMYPSFGSYFVPIPTGGLSRWVKLVTPCQVLAYEYLSKWVLDMIESIVDIIWFFLQLLAVSFISLLIWGYLSCHDYLVCFVFINLCCFREVRNFFSWYLITQRIRSLLGRKQ